MRKTVTCSVLVVVTIIGVVLLLLMCTHQALSIQLCLPCFVCLTTLVSLGRGVVSSRSVLRLLLRVVWVVFLDLVSDVHSLIHGEL